MIIVGLALATVKIFYDGKPRLMSPSIFPEPNQLVYNTNGLVGATNPTNFITKYFPNGPEWNLNEAVTLETPGAFEDNFN